MTKITVIIVDDHELFRLGVRSAFETRHSDISVVGEAPSGAVFFDLLETVAADIVLLDILMPGMSGIEIAPRLKKERPEMKILAISAENSSEAVQEMLHIGIEGFVSKFDSGADNIAEAVRSVAEGYEYFGKDISDIIRRIYVAKKKTVEITSEFTEQEKRIIELCHEGLPAKLIADRLDITARTVEWHKSNIFRKLGINSTLEMVKYAVKTGIITG
jgi:DNA-binding NarL/FixJ family response regulator